MAYWGRVWYKRGGGEGGGPSKVVEVEMGSEGERRVADEERKGYQMRLHG